jgi:hypothetical protein
MSTNQTQDMFQLRQAIESFLYQFDELVEQFGFEKSYRALRRQYSIDEQYLYICCNGDRIINNVIDGLASQDVQYYVKLLEEYKDEPPVVTRLVNDYLLETVKDLKENNLLREALLV